ncbi:MAG: hypothetical protein AAGK97_03350, partial [Bacteroidota bacterium]
NPSPLLIPEISTTKEVATALPAASGIEGNYDITYSVIVENTGTTPLENILLEDDIATQLAPAFVMVVSEASIVSSSATTDPLTGTIPQLLDGTGGVLLPGEQVVIEFTIEINPSLIPAMGLTNQVEATGTPTDGMGNPIPDPNNPGGTLDDVSDLSDSGNDPAGDNPDAPGDMGTPNDPTPLPPLPGISVTKVIDIIVPNDDGTFTLTYVFGIKNTGNTALSNISLEEDFADQYGCAYIGNASDPIVTPVVVTGTAPTANTSYEGLGINTDLLNGDGTLLAGDSITVSVVVDLDPSCATATSPLENQAEVNGDPTEDDGTPLVDDTGMPLEPVSDLSDDATDVDGDGIPDNETGGTDDPTLLDLPNIAVTKAVTGTEIQADGDVKITFELEVQNTGNTIITNISLLDTLDFLASAMPSTQLMPLPVIVTNINATTAPGASMTYDGSTDTELLDLTGELAPGEGFLVSFMVEVDPVGFAMIMPQPVTNQAVVSGIPVDTEDGMPLINPETGVPYEQGDLTDLSDDGTGLADNGDPTSDNMGADGEGLGDNPYDDPTPISLPGLIELDKALTTIEMTTTPGNALATYEFTIRNNGGTTISNLSLVDDFANEFGSGFIGVTMLPSIVMSVSDAGSTDPTPNGGFTGFAVANDLLIGTDGVLAPGDSVVISVQVELDIDALPEPAFNQGEVTGENPDGSEVSDLSDDVSDIDGDGNNDNETGGPDDPTPLPPFPSINIAKSVNNVVDAPTPDRYFVTYRHIIQNTGNTVLENLILTDDMVTALQGGYIGTTSIVVLPGSPAAQMNPVAAAGTTVMDGVNNALDGMSGILNPGEQFIVDITVEIDITLITGTQPLLNQSMIEGTPTDGMGNTLTDPTTGQPYQPGDVTDTSDSGTDPDGSNPGAPNDTGGFDDPTPLGLPGEIAVVKTISMTAPAASGTFGNYDVTIDFVIENTGSNTINSIDLSDMIASQWGDAWVGVVTPPMVTVNGTDANTTDPTVNGGFDGEFDIELLNGDGALSPDEFISVQVVVEVDASAAPADGLENQATVMATDSLGNMISDLSDDNTSSTDPADPDGDNPNGAG